MGQSKIEKCSVAAKLFSTSHLITTALQGTLATPRGIFRKVKPRFEVCPLLFTRIRKQIITYID